MKYLTKSKIYIPPAPTSIAYFPAHPINISKYDFLRKTSLEYLPVVHKRLEWIVFYETVAKEDASKTAKYFGLSRKTFHKWYRRFKDSHHNLDSLMDMSRAPKNKRVWQVTPVEEDRILKLRKDHMRYGKKKLKRLYLREYGLNISAWKIERVIRKHKLYTDSVKNKRMQIKRAKGKLNPRLRVHSIPKPESVGALWHIDSIILYFEGLRRSIITAIDEVSKIGYARMYTSNTSRYTKDFMQRLMYLTEGNIQVIHTDNGSEFDGSFADVVKELNIPRVYSRPHTPKDNPVNERFNRTLQEEWLEGALFDPNDLIEANKQLTTWLIEYNTFRPHESIDQLTPVEYVESTLKVLPMCPARTLFQTNSATM